MFIIYITIIFIILLVIFLFHAQETKHLQEMNDRIINEEKRVQNEVKISVRFAKNELLFKQNQNIISELFDSKKYWTEIEIKKYLTEKYPHESVNYCDDLFFDLYNADLIGSGYFQINYSESHKEMYFKGDSNYNLIFSFPRLIAFLRSKADYEQNQISNELHDKLLVRKCHIKTKIRSNPDAYYFFGVVLGEDLPKYVNTSGLEIFSNNFYLYISPLGYSYLLKNDLKTNQYQQIFENWLKGNNDNFFKFEVATITVKNYVPAEVPWEDLIR